MNNLLSWVGLAIAGMLLTGCSAIPLNPEGKQVVVSSDPPQVSCHYIGEVFGTQGNWFTGIFTPNKNILEGSVNMVRNEAAQHHANYVYIDNQKLSGTFETASLTVIDNQYLIYGWIGGHYNATLVGQAYRCATLNKGVISS